MGAMRPHNRLRSAATSTVLLLAALACYYLATQREGMRVQAAAHQLLSFAGGQAANEKLLTITISQPAPRAGIYFWDPAEELPGLPPCDHEDPTSLAPLVKRWAVERNPLLAEAHEYDQHATPWYFERALLRARGLLAPSVDSAEKVLVAASCYYEAAWWSKRVSEDKIEALVKEGRLPATPLQLMSRILDAVPASVSPQRAILFFPAPYNAGCNGTHVWMSQATTLAIERQASCGQQKKAIVVPYNANGREVQAELSFDNRPTLVTFVGGGSKDAHRSAGQRLRHQVGATIPNNTESFIHNGCMGCSGAIDHTATVAKYQNSTFCLVLAGDTQSSRRASEVIVHGCLPVFLGPPFNSAPFASDLNYSSFSLVVHVNDTSSWASTPDHKWQMQNWTSEAGPPTHTIGNLSDLVYVLRTVSPERIQRMQEALQRARRAFLWTSVLSPERPAAVDLALHQLLPSYQPDVQSLLP